MLRTGRSGRLLFAAAAWSVVSAVASPGPAAAAPVPLLIAEAGPVLAGQVLTVTWAPPGEQEFDEMELVLSLDRGRTWPIRITGDLGPQATGASFRVPSLPAEEAIVGLRAGRDGERESEEILARSAPFPIRAPVPGGGEALHRVQGEWRTAAAMAGQTDDGPALPGVFGAPAVGPDTADGPAVDGGSDEALLAQPTGSPLARLPGARFRPAAPPAASARPSFTRRE